MICHITDSFRSKYPEWFLPLQDPWGKDQIRVSSRVIRVQVCAERGHQPVRAKRVDPIPVCLRRLADDPRTEINEVRPVANNDRGGRTAGIRTRVRSSGTEKYKFCLHHDFLSFFSSALHPCFCSFSSSTCRIEIPVKP